jgi:hypothetical protein
MRNKISIIAVTFLTIAMMASPVFAMGPVNSADKNPNVSLDLVPGVSILPPSGIDVDWVLYQVPVPQHVIWMNASTREIKNAFIVTDVHQIFVMENTWLYLSPQMFYDLMLLNGVQSGAAAYLASQLPDGTYMRWTTIGK